MVPLTVPFSVLRIHLFSPSPYPTPCQPISWWASRIHPPEYCLSLPPSQLSPIYLSISALEAKFSAFVKIRLE